MCVCGCVCVCVCVCDNDVLIIALTVELTCERVGWDDQIDHFEDITNTLELSRKRWG